MAEHAGLHPDRTGLNGSGSRIEVRAPADGALLGTVPNLSPAAVAAMLSRARAAQAEWGQRPVRERAALLNRFRERLAERAAEAAELSSIWTGRRRGEALVGRLRAGMVSVNDVLYHAAVAGLPFGGMGNSGYGRVHGEEGMREMTQTRAVLVDRSGIAREPIGGFPFRRFGLARAHGLVGFLHGRGTFARARAAVRLLRNRS